jgi:hypothetical protein
MYNIYVLLIFVLVTGCATHSTLTVSSQPSGAYITETGTGTAFGIAPVVLSYDAKALSAHKDASGCYLVKGFNAKWASGATTSSEPKIRLCGSNTGAYTYSLSRDTNAEGLDIDLDFAMRQNTVNAQQAQARAAQKAAAIQAWNAIQAAQPKSVAPINCDSFALGNSVQTNCR